MTLGGDKHTNYVILTTFRANSSPYVTMRHFGLLCVAFALYSGSLLAQTTFPIQGTLRKTIDRRPVDFANVLLRSPRDSTLITGVVTDSLGRFRLMAPQGKYHLEIRALGLKPYHKSLTLSGALDLGELLLEDEAKQLATVQVTAKRPIMQRKADRMVFDASQIATAASSALDVLRQTPGVNVSDEGISLIGKGSVIVLINDKRVRLSGTALVNLLRTYPHSDLTEIQILTTPPAKYEAEGNAGILNIILKKAKNDFFGGSASAYAGFNEDLPSYRVSTGLNYKQDKLSTSLQASAGMSTFGGDFGTFRTYPKQELYSSSETTFEIENRNLNLRVGLDYAFTPELTLGFNLSYAPDEDRPHRKNDSRDYATPPGNIRYLLRSMPGRADETKKSDYTTANLHLEKSFKSVSRRRLSWDADYVSYRSREERNFASRTLNQLGVPTPGGDFRFNAQTDQRTTSYITSLDYTEPLGAGTLGFGVKGTWTRTHNSNDYDASSTLGERHDRIRFDEHVYALYADLNEPLSPKWSLRTGLRMEYTHTEGMTNGRRLEHLQSYLNVFPSLFVGYNPNERHAFNLSSNVRLSRPHFGQLSPFVRYENQNSVLLGKEDLHAAKRANLTLGYTFMGVLNFELSGGYLWDGIAQVVRLDPATNQASYRHENAEKTSTLRLENSFVYKLGFMQTYLSHTLWYSDTKITTGAQRTDYGGASLTYGASTYNTFFLNRSKTLQATCYLYYRTPSYDNGFHISHLLIGGAGLSYTLLDGKLRLALSADNLITTRYKATLTTPDYHMLIDNISNRRYIGLGVTYSFGAQLKDKAESKNAKELRSRM